LAWLAEESLRESGAMRTSGDRLILLAELALWCYQHGEKALAATAAQSLATSSTRSCNAAMRAAPSSATAAPRHADHALCRIPAQE